MRLPAFDVVATGPDRHGAAGFSVGSALAALVNATAICRVHSIDAIAAAGESAGRQSLQRDKADRHADETAGNVGQCPFALGRATQDHLLPQRPDG